MDRRLYRSRSDRVIAGVCGGIAAQANVDPVLIRLAAVLLALATSGALIIAYIIMAIVVPEEPLDATPVPGESRPATAGGQEAVMADKNDEATTPVVPAPEVPPAPEVLSAQATPAPVATVQQRPRRRGGVGLGVVLIIVGLALLANQFIPDFDLWRYWPVAVILVGVASVMRGLKG